MRHPRCSDSTAPSAVPASPQRFPRRRPPHRNGASMTAHFKILLGVILAVLVASASGAEKDHAHNEHDHDHDAATAPSTGPAKGEHDHGHADEVKLTADAIRQWNVRVAPVERHVLTARFTAPARVAFNAEAMAHV